MPAWPARTPKLSEDDVQPLLLPERIGYRGVSSGGGPVRSAIGVSFTLTQTAHLAEDSREARPGLRT